MYGTLEQTLDIKRDRVHIGGIPVRTLVAKYGTPLYVIDEEAVRAQCRAFHRAFAATGVRYDISYASKAMCIQALCRIVAQEQLSLDVVSAGELHTALSAGVDAARIHLHGNNKSEHELYTAVRAGVGYIVVDHFDEIEALERIAASLSCTVHVMVRLTPGVVPHTHASIATGQDDSKFGFQLRGGIALEAARRIVRAPHLVLHGVHVHIGSQLMDAAPYVQAVSRIAEFVRAMDDALGVSVGHINVGGGFGIQYTHDDHPDDISDTVRALVRAAQEAFGDAMPVIGIEPGRSIVGAAGTTVYTVGAIKRIPGVRTYVTVDGGMTDNPRPALYGSTYRAALIAHDDRQSTDTEVVTIAGKCCESGDVLLRDVALPRVHVGDWIAVHDTGAYNYAMASNYNRFPRPAVVLVCGGVSGVVVVRETVEDVVRLDRMPPWL